jgi:hypothetical protein
VGQQLQCPPSANYVIGSAKRNTLLVINHKTRG